MKRFAILRNPLRDRDGFFSREVMHYLCHRGAECTVTEDARTIPDASDCVVVLGGDGTLLRTAKHVVDRQIPLFGINLGTLGYLAEVNYSAMYPALDALISDSYTIEQRMMLKGSIYRDEKLMHTDVALNDVVLNRQGPLRILSFKCYVNGAYLCTYNADGVILSTATGSTGYSLSVGGPIVAPETNIIMLSAIAPHTLNTRSIVMSGRDRITVEIGTGHLPNEAEALVAFDGEFTFSAATGDRVVVEQAEKKTNIIKISNMSFLEVLRRKMAYT